jgi:hypothetical protein
MDGARYILPQGKCSKFADIVLEPARFGEIDGVAGDAVLVSKDKKVVHFQHLF